MKWRNPFHILKLIYIELTSGYGDGGLPKNAVVIWLFSLYGHSYWVEPKMRFVANISKMTVSFLHLGFYISRPFGIFDTKITSTNALHINNDIWMFEHYTDVYLRYQRIIK